LVLVDELPRNPVGKVLKRELRERYANVFIPARIPTESAH